MHKKFVSLDNPTPAESNPYHIKTWQPPVFRNDSPQSAPFEMSGFNNSFRTLKPKHVNVQNTLKREFRKINQIEGAHKIKKKCDPHDSFEQCVRLKRSRKEIQDHAFVREKVLDVQEKIRDGDCRVLMKTKESSDLIKFESLSDIGPVKLASPSPSFATAAIPSKRLLALKKVKSGIFINETPYKNVEESELDYNPRILQERLEEQYSGFDISEINNQRYVRLPKASNGAYPEKRTDISNQPSVIVCKDDELQNFLRPNLKNVDLEWRKSSADAVSVRSFEINNDLNMINERVGEESILRTCLRSRVDTVLFSEFRLKRTSLGETNRRRPKEIAAIYSAYAQSFIQPLRSWNMSTMLQIFQTGEMLQEKSIATNYENCNSDFDIDPYIVISKTPMTLDYLKLSSKNQTLPQALRNHFVDKNSCLVGCHNALVLIWKQCTDFFVFDPQGRNRETLVPDELNGYATLLRCSNLQDLINLISCDWNADCKSNFRLYDIRLRDYNIMNTTIAKTEGAQLSKPKKNYAVVNEYYAVIRGKEGLRVNVKVKINPSMLMSCLARIYADIGEPRFWTSNVLDQLRKYSLLVYQKQVKAEKLKAFTISNLKSAYRIGSFRTEVVTMPFVASGKLSDCPTFRCSQLSAAVCHFFKNYENGLIEIDSSTMAAWKDRSIFYVYDPFCRSANGVSRDNDPKGAACLQIHLNLRSLCQIVYENARKMSPTGNFFIHALKVIRTRVVHHSKLKSEKVTFPILLLDYPAKCESSTKSISENLYDFLPRKGYLNKCLSVLSVSPCERTCSETDVLEMERKEKLRLKKLNKSMERNSENVAPLSDEAKIPWHDSYDVIEPIVEDLVDICCRNASGPDQDNLIGRARRVLLKSDKDNLKGLLKSVERGDDYDNYFTEFSRAPTIAKYANSLESELKAETAFELIPDGDWIVVGSKKITDSEEDFDLGILSAFVTAILAGKYNIKFWSEKLLDYSVRNAMALRSSMQISGNLLGFLTRATIPNMEIGQSIFSVSVEQLAFGSAKDLQNILLKSFQKRSDLVLVFNTFSCAIFKRSVFYFLYVGHPCDIMGFRRPNSGAPTLVRALDLDSVVRRIHANRFSTSLTQKGTVFGIKTKDVTNRQEPFVALTPSEEEFIYNQEKDKLKKKDDQRQMKVLFLKDELKRENQRIAAFRQDKYADEEEDFEREEEDNAFEEDPQPSPKHLPGTELPSSMYDERSKKKDSATGELGYRYYKPDNNFKIQGSTALVDRQAAEKILEIRPCHFASLLAIMYAIHLPLKDWDFRRIDMVIETAKQFDNQISDKSVCCSRKISNVFVDDFVYNLEIKKDELSSDMQDNPIQEALKKISRSRNYFLIQFSNMSFAVHKADFFHLFDPYSTLDIINESTSMNKPRHLTNVKPSQDKNTASWITFPNLDFLLTYIEERVTSLNWQTEFNLYVVNILSVKKAPKKHRLIHMLANSPINRVPSETEYEIARLQTEQIAWIDMSTGNLPWSPLLPSNMNNDKRGSIFSKWKSFDVELPGKLYSMWGSIHPRSAVFGNSRGKQFLAINVIACCMAHAYQIEEWTPNILDAIVVNGDKYFRESLSDIVRKDYELTLEDLNTEFHMSELCHFVVHLESVAFGLLYDSRPRIFNLSRALSYFFVNHRYGIIQCLRKSLCFGKTRSGYFLFDCQSHGEPLLAPNQGCAYILVAATLDTLLYCMIMTLNVTYYNIEFVIHAVMPGIKKSGSTTTLSSSTAEKFSQRTLAEDPSTNITTNAAEGAFGEFEQTPSAGTHLGADEAKSLVSSERN